MGGSETSRNDPRLRARAAHRTLSMHLYPWRSHKSPPLSFAAPMQMHLAYAALQKTKKFPSLTACLMGYAIILALSFCALFFLLEKKGHRLGLGWLVSSSSQQRFPLINGMWLRRGEIRLPFFAKKSKKKEGRTPTKKSA